MSANTMILREIEYTFFLTEKGTASRNLIELLGTELLRFEDWRKSDNKNIDAIKQFLKRNIESSILPGEGSKIYFLAYDEKTPGTIRFTLFLVCDSINFSIVRQALERLIKDSIGRYFEDLLLRNVMAGVTIHSAENEISGSFTALTSQKHETGKNSTDFISIIIAAVALVMALTTGLAWFVQDTNSKNFTDRQVFYKDKYYDLIIDQQVNKAIEEKRKAGLLHFQKAITDSTSK